MKKLLLLTLLLLPLLPAKAQSWSGRSTYDGRVVPPYRFCVGEDNGADVCLFQSQINVAKFLNGTLDYRLTTRTVATLPAAAGADNIGRVYRVIDGTSSGDCTSGGGSSSSVCYSNGAAWVPLGSGGSGGGACVSGGTNVLSKFISATQVCNSSASDDGITPTRTPDGVNTASGPVADEWIVDTGGVVANELVCRSASSAAKVIICPAGATTTVIGVAQSTQAAGNTVTVCWAAKCNVIADGNTAVNDWLIPSPSVAGQVHDTGSTTPPTAKTFAWPAETSVTTGNAVLVTISSLDTLIAASTGGNIPPCPQYSLPDYTGAGTSASLGCVNPPATPTNGSVYIPTYLPNGAQVAPVNSQPGLPGRTVSTATDTILCADRAPGAVYFANGAGTTETVPDVGSTCFSSSPAFRAVVLSTSGTVTFNRTSASTFTVCNGATCTPSLTTFTLASGQSATFTTPDNTNWLVSTTGASGHHGLVFNIGDPGNGVALTVAATTTSYLRVPFACTIKDYSLMIDAGTITVKFWKIATGTAIPTSANSINTSGVSISSGTAIRSTTLSDFTTTSVAANDFMAMNVTAVATAKFVNGVLSCQE